MPEIYVAIRNAQETALSSVNGTAVLVLVVRAGQTVYQKPVTLRAGMAQFSSLPGGTYTVIARHPDLTPTEARYDHVLIDKTILGVKFVYNEPQRQLTVIAVEVNQLP